jgi:phosphonate transport system substrate-binding protein
VRYHVARSGLGPGFFGEVIESGAHQLSLSMILDGAVDASAIDTMVWDREIALCASRYEGRLRSIATLGPSPAPPWVVRRGFPAELRDRLQQTLVTMHEDPEGRAILASGQTRRFAVVTDRDYDPIREMERTANGIQLCRP